MEQKTAPIKFEAAERRVKFMRSIARTLNEMYNQNMASEDSEKTSFIYHKILAIEFVIALFSVVSIFIALMMQFETTRLFSDTRCKYLLGVFTLLTIVAIFLQTKCRVKWNDEKKQPAINSYMEYFWWIVESLVITPAPNFWVTGSTTLFNFSTQEYEVVSTDSLFTVYLLIRTTYILKFLVHSESYYGSRPDRLSRLYAVNFGTFNAVKYLINEKPFASLLIIYLLTILELPLALFIIESPINPLLKDYSSCLYFAVVSESTVGYGDTNAVTFIGRCLAIVMIVMGNTFTSLVLIFIIRSITFTSTEEDAHFLRGQLEVKYQVKKALVRRIEEQRKVGHNRYSKEQREEKMRQLRIFRLDNRRMIHASNAEPGNIKRLMLKNFSEMLQAVRSCRDKQQLLKQYCDVIEESENQQKTRCDPEKKSRQYQILEQKIISSNVSSRCDTNE